MPCSRAQKMTVPFTTPVMRVSMMEFFNMAQVMGVDAPLTVEPMCCCIGLKMLLGGREDRAKLAVRLMTLSSR